MKKLLFTLCLLGTVLTLTAQQIPSKDVQIKTALMAAPEATKEGAKVYGYDAQGKFVQLRAGSNEMICIADDPKTAGFSVSCYHKDLEPFMERGRQLKNEDKSFKEIFDIREEEAKNGKLKMPKDGATLYVLNASADDYDSQRGEVKTPISDTWYIFLGLLKPVRDYR